MSLVSRLSTQSLSTTDLPAGVHLLPSFDPQGLQKDLSVLQRGAWLPEEPYQFKGLFGSETKVFHDGRWSGLSLRSQGGRPDRTDPGGPGLEEFQDTEMTVLAPNVTRVMRVLNTPLRSARLLRLPPGASIGEHRDTYHGLEYGQLRLHVPIITNEGVQNVIRGEHMRWHPGELWYGDFGSPHYGRNDGSTDRVHFVVDALVTPGLLQLFPAEVAARFPDIDVLFHEEPMNASDHSLPVNCTFRLPSTLVRGIFDIDDGIQAEMLARITNSDGALYFEVEERRLFKLSRLSGNRLGFVGWTMERHFHYEFRAGRVTELSLRLLRGHQETTIQFQLLS